MDSSTPEDDNEGAFSPAADADSGWAPTWRSPLSEAADAAKSGRPPRVTVRKLLSWFDSQRRGSFVVAHIRQTLDAQGVETEPDFNSVWIDAEVTIIPKRNETIDAGAEERPEARSLEITSAAPAAESEQAAADFVVVGGAIEDPTYRIGKLDAANKPVLSVAPNQSIEYAVTQMLANGFSQLPVMQGEREVKGMVTWESIGARFALGNVGQEVRGFMAAAQIIGFDRSLFSAIDLITQHQYVLVRAPDQRISGIITSADLSRQFQQLTEPFLLLSETEQHIRKLIVGKFKSDELKQACDPGDSNREINNVADLTMGEYIRLLENPTHWERLALRIDRALFVEKLQTVRRIRNDIMHFDPDPLGPDDLASLRQFVIFVQSLRELGAF
jgi:CBS domain-containing protein